MPQSLLDVADEFAGVSLGDVRLDKRALAIVGVLASDPDKSFPAIADTDAALEALYRFVNNERVDPEALLASHYRETAQRASQAPGRVIVSHDTTGFSFGGEVPRDGLGRIKTGGQGFYLHAGLVIDDSTGCPYGVIGMIPVFRDGPPLPAEEKKKKEHNREREFARWKELAEVAGDRLQGRKPVHVMDREADAYELFAYLTEANQDFVIRSKDNRILDVPRGNAKLPAKRRLPRLLYEAVSRATFMLSREVVLSTKRPDRMSRLRKAPGRMTRVAHLEVTATRVSVRHPPYCAGKSRRVSELPRAVPMNVVHVYEAKAPKNQQPIDWLLLTTLPVETEVDVAYVIDCYRRRWLIEEYFKAIKTGCAYEKRQLESKHALLNALALFVPIAWRLLNLRYLGREFAACDISVLLSKRQIEILVARGKLKPRKRNTARDGMLAVAAEGGHLKANGDPGWQILGRGYEKLLYMELGYVLGAARRK